MARGAKHRNWRIVGIWALRVLALVLAVGTLLSATDLNQWWIRGWDFPRIQVLIALVASAIALFLFDRKGRPYLPLALAALSAWQAYRIYPYTPLSPTEVADIDAIAARDEACFSLLTLNVLQTNRDYDRTIALIDRLDPDLVLLMENDAAWSEALSGVLARYPNQLARPLDNTYGMHFATRLPMRDAWIEDLAQKDTPSVFATLEASGVRFRLMGLHPRPPHPGQDTEERDAEIVMAARRASESPIPVLALGDFNDVAWSDTTRLFRDLGGFLDPRVGRGTYATFPADLVWLGWPLDHLFVTEHFLVDAFRVGDPVGSDHRPVIARLCVSPKKGPAVNAHPDAPDSEDREEARDVMEEYEEDTQEDRVEGE